VLTTLSALLLLAGYDPLIVAPGKPTVLELVAKNAEREVPVRVYLPAKPGPAPVILFSHGLGGSRANDEFLALHWAGRGYVAVFLQHAGSDDAVWKDLPPEQRYSALKAAANVENFFSRVKDVHAVIDALQQWQAEAKHPLEKRLDLAHLGMSGHSFGAVTTQAVSGQLFPLGGDLSDARIKAAMALSPSVPRRGDAKRAFGSVTIPWLLMTGTHDASPIGGQTPESRLGVYAALPPLQKYQLVLEGAEHSAFSDRALPGDSKPRNPNHHKLMLAFSTAFFDSVLRSDKAAKVWLEGAGAKALLEAGDRWEWK
jgi:predicted dienelactone hydrolase